MQRGDQWANTQRDDQQRHRHDDAHDAVERGHRRRESPGPAATRRRSRKSNSGDVYAGHDGNVYKKDASGGWQKYDNGSWNNVQQPTQAQKQQAQTQASARASGPVPTPRR